MNLYDDILKTMIPKALSRLREQPIFVFLPMVFLVVLIKNAWLGDDAFITARLAKNFAEGYGMRWNLAERTYAFTHPLWMFLMTFCIRMFKNADIYHILVGLSLAVSFFVSLVFVFYTSGKKGGAFLVGVLMIFSKAFVDYSASGLENPLSHLLLLLFYIVFLKDKNKPIVLYTLGSLICLTRHDNLLFIAPALVYLLVKDFNKKNIGNLFLGFSPFILWTLFSTFYFGFPLPNTAYAKLAGSFTPGGNYFMDSLLHDPITLIVVFSAVFVGFVSAPKFKLVSIGILIHMFYVYKVGGDFMSGRFFTCAFMISLVILAHGLEKVSKTNRLGILILALTLGTASPFDPFNDVNKILDLVVKPVQQEKEFYFKDTGLVNNIESLAYKNNSWYQQGKDLEKDAVFVHSTTGFLSMGAPREAYILDSTSLSDPFMSHIPPSSKKSMRAGHVLREIPKGYLKSLEYGFNMVEDSCLHEYYDKIMIISRWDLFNPQRLATVVKMNLGQYNYLLKGDCKVSI
ncbi:hypothetical protein OAL67_00505 [bacterium]|nr:hypothetical protein [bacterium]